MIAIATSGIPMRPASAFGCRNEIKRSRNITAVDGGHNNAGLVRANHENRQEILLIDSCGITDGNYLN